MDWREYEQATAELFKSLGYSATIEGQAGGRVFTFDITHNCSGVPKWKVKTRPHSPPERMALANCRSKIAASKSEKQNVEVTIDRKRVYDGR